MQVQLFIPCYIDQFFPETGRNMVAVLEKLGCRLTYNTQQTCCGQAAYNAGFQDMAKEVGEKFIGEFKPGKKVVCPSGSCVSMVKGPYNKLFQNTVQHNACKELQKNLFEFSEYMLPIVKEKEVFGQFKAKAIILDACQAMRECGISAVPRELLSRIKDLEILESSDRETCCGFGGVFSVKSEALSVEFGRIKIEEAVRLGVDYIVSTDLSCLMHLQSIIDKDGIPLKTIHIADLLAKSMGVGVEVPEKR